MWSVNDGPVPEKTKQKTMALLISGLITQLNLVGNDLCLEVTNILLQHHENYEACLL